MVQALLSLFPQPPFRNVALQCLTEVRVQSGACGWACMLHGRKPGRAASWHHMPGAHVLVVVGTRQDVRRCKFDMIGMLWVRLCVQVGSLTMPPEFNTHFGQFFRLFTEQLATILPPDTNLPAAFDNGTDEQQAFVQNLALFYTGYFRVRPLGRNPACVDHCCPLCVLSCGACLSAHLHGLRNVSHSTTACVL
jgi:hypothetical protein